jgi:hypothetical protein
MITMTAVEVTYFEVVWGDDEADRIVYADEHDGTFISETAEVRATSKFLELSKHGVRCGFFVNGNLTAGENVTYGPDQRPAVLDDPDLYARWVAGELNDDGSPKVTPVVEHKTRTVLDAHQSERYVTKSNGSCGRFVRSDTSVALCSCGWKRHAGTREEARSAARAHRSAVALAA